MLRLHAPVYPITLSYCVVDARPAVTPRMRPVRGKRSEGDGLGGVGEQGADVGEELGALLAVYYAVVYGQR